MAGLVTICSYHWLMPAHIGAGTGDARLQQIRAAYQALRHSTDGRVPYKEVCQVGDVTQVPSRLRAVSRAESALRPCLPHAAERQ